MKHLVALLLALALAATALGSEPPAQVNAVVAAAATGGLLTQRDFSTKVLSQDELQRLKTTLQQRDWVAEIPGLETALLSNFPAEAGVHEKSGFSLSVHYSGDRIMLLRASVPLVNGSEKEAKAMIETMLAATEALIGQTTDVRPWLDAEWRRSWELSAKLFEKQPAVKPSDIVRKKTYGPYLVTVWGVVPDIVYLHCIRIAEKQP